MILTTGSVTNTNIQTQKQTTLLLIEYKNTNPTLGKPTIPHFNEVPILPISGVSFSSSFFFGGIFPRRLAL
jgi:hypothetical protein